MVKALTGSQVNSKVLEILTNLDGEVAKRLSRVWQGGETKMIRVLTGSHMCLGVTEILTNLDGSVAKRLSQECGTEWEMIQLLVSLTAATVDKLKNLDHHEVCQMGQRARSARDVRASQGVMAAGSMTQPLEGQSLSEERITNIAVRRAELHRVTLKSLRDMCDQRNLKRTGSKAILIQRLLTKELTSGS